MRQRRGIFFFQIFVFHKSVSPSDINHKRLICIVEPGVLIYFDKLKKNVFKSLRRKEKVK